MAQLVVVANRLPVEAPTRGRGPWTRSPGGLAAALHPTLAARGGVWVGWAGNARNSSPPDDLGYVLRAVDLDPGDVRGYYDGLANATLWPLYHDLVRPPVYRRDWWDNYRRVNERFAETVARTAESNALVWIHDYHLQLVPAMLREQRSDLRIGFFLHIPFPAAELFAQLPWRTEILDGIAGADLVGFQTRRDADNFHEAAERVARADRRHLPWRPLCDQEVDAFPISVDYEHWNQLARRRDVEAHASQLRRQLGNPRTVLLGIDRLDYTKGIEHRLHAFRELLTEGRLTVPGTVLVQIASPSRDRTAAYRTERTRIEQLVGEINGDFGQVGLPAIHYLHKAVEPPDVAALYRAADVMLVTPIHDGMNLVAKEYVASQVEDHGVLVLSEFAGAADELTDAILVNPHDIEGLKRAILAALSMRPAEARRRMQDLRAVVARHTVQVWAQRFLDRLAVGGSPAGRANRPFGGGFEIDLDLDGPSGGVPWGRDEPRIALDE